MKELKYYKIYKPYGMLSQFSDEEARPVLRDLFNFPADVYSIGRLDSDSEGLLILTNDKSLTSLIVGPHSGAEKEYLVQVEGSPSREDLIPLREGVIIEGKKTLPAKAEIIIPPEIPPRKPPIRYRKSVPDTWLRIIIKEGRNRQVRKMTAKIGFPTLRLIRLRIKNVNLDNLKPGEVRELTKAELTELKKV